MKGLICDQFQNAVEETNIRNSNILDILSKLQQTSAKSNGAVVKSLTSCGCIDLKKATNVQPNHEDYDELKNATHTIEGELCQACKDKVIAEMGNHMFYIAALCSQLGLDMFDIIITEYNRLQTLGKYNLY